jgi:hypothetical protein
VTLPEPGPLHHLLELALAVGPGGSDASGAQLDPPPAPLRLWGGELAVGEGPVYLQRPAGVAKGYVLPPEAQQLAGPHARVDGQDVERFQSLAR